MSKLKYFKSTALKEKEISILSFKWLSVRHTSNFNKRECHAERLSNSVGNVPDNIPRGDLDDSPKKAIKAIEDGARGGEDVVAKRHTVRCQDNVYLPTRENMTRHP